MLCAMATFWALAQSTAVPADHTQPTVASAGDVGILYPANRSNLSSGKLAIIAVAPSRKSLDVKLDGQSIESERMTFAPAMSLRGTRLYAGTRPADVARAAIVNDAAGKSIWVAPVELSPGEHLIEAGDARAKIYYGGPTTQPARNGWAASFIHGYTKNTVINACEQCHRMSKDGQQRVLGPANPPQACEECHKEVDVQLTHRHVLDSVSKCHLCHDPHAAPGAMLLVDQPEKLCTQCHEGGHSKR